MRFLIAVIGALLIGIPDSNAQNQIRHTPPTVMERDQQHVLTFDVPGVRADQVQAARLFYRYGGDSSYEQQAVQRQEGAFTTRLSIDRAGASSVEYYFQLRTQDGDERTYPRQNAASDPVRVEVVEDKAPDPAATGGPTDDITTTILSPEPDGETTPGDAVLAVSFFYEDDSVDPDAFRVYLDGDEVTGRAEMDSHFLSYTPDRVAPGEHTALVTYQGDEDEYQLAKWSFTVTGAPDAAPALLQTESDDYVSGRVQLLTQSQEVGQSGSDIARGRFRLEGREGIVRYSANAQLTSEQSSRLQPQNRYGAELLFGGWGELRLGDAYPSLSRLTLAGRRIRGVDAKVKLFGENLNAQFLYGRLRRDIGNRYAPIARSIDTLGTSPDDTPVTDTTYTLPFADRGRGTYERRVTGGRLSVGDETPIQWGLNALRVRDDTSSLTAINDFTDVQGFSQDLTGSLNQGEEEHLRNNPNDLSVAGSSAKPKDNFAASTDLHLRLDDSQIQLDAEVGASLLNQDTRDGVLTQEKADELGVDLDPNTEDLLSQISWLIIVNEQMSTLPFRFEEQKSGDDQLEPFVPRGIFGGQSRASLDYLGQQVRVRYRWFGPEYTSLANSTLRQDLQGLNVSDRFQLFDNRLYVTLGYENLQNNVLDTRDATTTTETYRTNLSWYPVRDNLPRISVNASLRDRGNDVGRINPFVPADERMAAVRNVREDSTVISNPIQSFTTQLSGSITQQFDIGPVINDATLNVSYLQTEDEVFTYGGTKSLSYSLNVRNRYATLPLDTRFGVNVNQTESSGGLSSLDILGVSAGGTVFLLDRDLRLGGTFALTINSRTSRSLEINDDGTPNETRDDFYEPADAETTRESNSYVFNLNARYRLTDRHSFRVNADVNNVVAQDDRSLPNDRVLQFRYVYDF
jgi:hypothetical protein